MGGKRRLTAAEWFGRADQFLAAANYLETERKHLMIPNVVLRAFASEAYLKCLLTFRQKQFPPTHDLHLLFSRLPSEDRGQIEKEWNAAMLPMLQHVSTHTTAEFTVGTTLIQVLKQCAEAFKEWRYEVEQPRYWTLGGFARHVRGRITQLNPDWADDPPDIFGKQSKDRVR